MTKITSKKNMKMAGDLIYTVMGTVVMNVALQIIIYPIITHKFGEEVTGNILYFIGIIYAIPQALGAALGNSRLVMRKSGPVSNSDYKQVVFVSSVLTALCCGVIGFIEEFDLSFSVGYASFSVLYLLRSYAQVEFRIKLKFKEYFLYYCIISLGYLLGFGLYLITEIWIFIFAVGEAFALCYSILKGDIFKKEERKCSRKLVWKNVSLVAISAIARDCVLQFDKVMLKRTVDPETVTHYHIVSLIAKTMQMLIVPINTLIISYLTVETAKLTKKSMTKFFVISLAIGALFYGICIIGTPIYIKLFYANLYDVIIEYNYIVNLGLISGFLSSLFTTLLLSQGKTATRAVIECVFGCLYAVVAYYFIRRNGIMGLAWATLGMNILKMLFTAALLFSIVGKNSKKRAEVTKA